MKNTAKYAWSFSRNSSFLRGLYFMPLPVYKSYYTEYRRPWLNSGHVLGLVPVFYFLNIFIVQNVYTVMCFYCSACFGQL